MNTKELFQYFTKIEQTPKRLEMQEILVELFGKLSNNESSIVSYLLIGRIVPEFIPVEFQLSGKSLRVVVEEALGVDVTELLAKYGDIGSVWESEANCDSKSLSIEELYNALWEVASSYGTGSQQKKLDLITELIKKVDPVDGKYIIRIVNGKLRLGASDRTILDALGKADEKGEEKQLRGLYEQTSDLGYTVSLYQEFGNKAFAMGGFTPGIPVAAKLVEREDSIESIFKRIPEPIEEPKYDGLRIQVHVYKKALEHSIYADRIWADRYEEYMNRKSDSTPTLFDTGVEKKNEYNVSLFSRSLRDMTEMFPEVVTAAKKLPEQYAKKWGKEIDSLVLDGEVIGYSDEVNEYLSFKQTMSRKRKHNVGSAAEEVPVKVFVFDIMLAGEKMIMNSDLSTRKETLTFLDENTNIQKTIVKTPVHFPKTAEESDEIFMEYIGEKLEGVIFKEPTSKYTPGTRNYDWLKFKKAMKKDLADTVDVVLLGYYFGEGRLAEFGIGALLAGVYDKKENKFLTATKIGTGVTHEQWQEIKKVCDEVKTDQQLDSIIVPKSLEPDVWLTPSIVVEVEADEITKSPLHTAGFALRFPRFKKFREKTPEQATSRDELEKLAGL